jgi:transcriptional regulator with XRE-family HTH domain
MEHETGPSLDRALIGRIVSREIPRNRRIGTTQGLADASGVSRSTLYRVRDADPTIGMGTFARIEAALDLPPDTLITAGVHDLAGMVELGVAADLVEWVRREIDRPGNPARTMRTGT